MSGEVRMAIESTDCEVRCDNLTRRIYATDASIYKIEPLAVAFPRTAQQAGEIIQSAAQQGMSVIARGAGTGLTGGALGKGLVVDFARYNRCIFDIDPEAKTVCVQAGVVLDDLNAKLKPYGMWFGPDVATSSRATLGGMIANNSSGAHAPIYGTTAEHVLNLELVLSDGSTVKTDETLRHFKKSIDRWIESCRPAIRERLPKTLCKRWPGYGLDRYLDHGDLVKILCGSEGTLAGILQAKLKISPLPAEKGLAIIAFDSVSNAMQATVELLDLEPAAIEHIDRILFDQTKDHIAFKATRDFLQLDEKSCQSMLIVEFYDGATDKLAALEKRKIGKRLIICPGEREMTMVWELRKAGLSLLTGCPGSAKPISGIEDVAVPPSRLPEYVDTLQKLFRSVGVQGSFYGHAASGLLHIRPVLDLHEKRDSLKLRKIADEVFALAKQFKGSIAAEHGVGIARTEYLEEHLGPDLMEITRKIKDLFDPMHIMNPGKIVSDGTYKIDERYRHTPALKIDFEPSIEFAKKDKSFLGNLQQCNGDGACLKSTPSMCPTYQASGEEIMSPRGRSNAIRSILQDYDKGDPLLSLEIEKALEYCLSCKACQSECPSNVDMALLKAQLLHARYRKYGLPPVAWLLSHVDRLAPLGSATAPLANFILTFSPFRVLLEKFLGIASKRTLPLYAKKRFDRWFAKRTKPGNGSKHVFLWDDTFVRHHEPQIGRAAVLVLEAAGYRVSLLKDRKCCGRPAFSAGDLDRAYRLGKYNVDLLKNMEAKDPIIFLEPSCYSMFAEDYAELGIPNAKEVSHRAILFEHFLSSLLEKDPGAIHFHAKNVKAAMHVHCHAKATTAKETLVNLLKHIPGGELQMLNTGCCGMAGAFGMMASKYRLSIEVAQALIEQIEALPVDIRVIANGISCRQQIRHLSNIEPLHIAELLASAL